MKKFFWEPLGGLLMPYSLVLAAIMFAFVKPDAPIFGIDYSPFASADGAVYWTRANELESAIHAAIFMLRVGTIWQVLAGLVWMGTVHLEMEEQRCSRAVKRVLMSAIVVVTVACVVAPWLVSAPQVPYGERLCTLSKAGIQLTTLHNNHDYRWNWDDLDGITFKTVASIPVTTSSSGMGSLALFYINVRERSGNVVSCQTEEWVGPFRVNCEETALRVRNRDTWLDFAKRYAPHVAIDKVDDDELVYSNTKVANTKTAVIYSPP
jgi:hypothetical protein